MTPLNGFLHAPVIDQLIFTLSCAAVIYGIVRPDRRAGGAFLGLLIVLGFFVLALGAMSYVAAGGGL